MNTMISQLNQAGAGVGSLTLLAFFAWAFFFSSRLGGGSAAPTWEPPCTTTNACFVISWVCWSVLLIYAREMRGKGERRKSIIAQAQPIPL